MTPGNRGNGKEAIKTLKRRSKRMIRVSKLGLRERCDGQDQKNWGADSCSSKEPLALVKAGFGDGVRKEDRQDPIITSTALLYLQIQILVLVEAVKTAAKSSKQQQISTGPDRQERAAPGLKVLWCMSVKVAPSSRGWGSMSGFKCW